MSRPPKDYKQRLITLVFPFLAFAFFSAQAFAEKNSVHLRLIVVGSEEAAGEILSEVDAGKSFALLAKERSTDENSRDRCGDLGEQPIRSIDPALRKAASALKSGEVSGVIKVGEERYAVIQAVDLRYYRKGAAAFKVKDYGTAEDNLLKHVEANPDAVKARVMLGRIAEAGKDDDKAARFYQDALFYDPSHEEAYVRLGSLYVRNGRYEDARTLYEEGLKHLPEAEFFKLGIKVANAHLSSAPGQKEQGRVYLRIIVLRTEPEANEILSEIRKGTPFVSLAKKASVDDKSREACGYLGEVEVGGLDKPIQEALSHMKDGDMSGVIKLGDNRYVIVQKTDIVHFLDGEKAFINGDFKTAEAELVKHVELNPDSMKALVMLAKINEDRKEFDRAEEMYRRAISFDPSSVVVYERLARLYLLKGQYRKAKELYQEGLTHVPSSGVLAEGLEITDILMIGGRNRIP